jgi:hypothetical protein
MERVYLSYPRDREAAIFYALALLGTAQSSDKTYANQKKAAAILNRILPQEPQHPGVAHYLIHSFDYPALAQLALPAARTYAKIAPSSALAHFHAIRSVAGVDSIKSCFGRSCPEARGYDSSRGRGF